MHALVNPGDPPIDFHPSMLARPNVLAWVTLACALGAYILLGIPLQLFDVGLGIWVTEVFLLLGISWSLVRASGRTPWQYGRLEAPSIAQMLFGFVLGVVNYFAFVIPLQFIATSIAPKDWLVDESKIFLQQSHLELTLVAVGVGVVAPLCEEFLFRGVFQQGLFARLRPMAAIALAAAVFSAFHFDIVGFVARFELGFLFGTLFFRYDSLWPGIFAHAANNLVPTAMFFAITGPAADQEPTAGEVFRLSLLGLGAFVLVVLAAKWLPALKATTRPEAPSPAPEHAPGFLTAYRPWAICGIIVIVLWMIGAQLGRRVHHARPPAKTYKL